MNGQAEGEGESGKRSSNLLTVESAMDGKPKPRSNSLSTIIKMRLTSAKTKFLHRISLSADEDDECWKMGEPSATKDDNGGECRKWKEKRRSLFTTAADVDESDGLEQHLHRKQAIDNSLVQENIAAVASSLRVHDALRESGLI